MHCTMHRKWWVAFREDYNLILIEQYLVLKTDTVLFIFRILPRKTKITNKIISVKEMPCNLLAVDDIWELHLLNRHLSFCDPGAFPRCQRYRDKENAHLWEAHSLEVALQNSLVHPWLVYIDKRFGIAAGRQYWPAFGHFKEQSWYTSFWVRN